MTPNLPKNLNAYWTISAFLAFWFLFIHTPPVIVERNAIKSVRFMTHLFAVYIIYLGCIVNAMWTPSSLSEKARGYHIWVGRLAMVGGLVGFSSGVSLAWYPYGVLPIGFAAFITGLGLIQLYAQYFGYAAIKRYQCLQKQIESLERAPDDCEETEEGTQDVEYLREQKKEALQSHVFHMVMLFVVACGFPAGLRVAAFFGTHAMLALVVIYVVLSFMVKPYKNTYFFADESSEVPTLSDTAGELSERLVE
mmetsp:Transcript_2546/g.4358  ORF Transcript_2546/g.4358 Transcript_2546/m.4358 type:complete len:251 (+) Transcript_2546:79-831(+)